MGMALMLVHIFSLWTVFWVAIFSFPVFSVSMTPFITAFVNIISTCVVITLVLHLIFVTIWFFTKWRRFVNFISMTPFICATVFIFVAWRWSYALFFLLIFNFPTVWPFTKQRSLMLWTLMTPSVCTLRFFGITSRLDTLWFQWILFTVVVCAVWNRYVMIQLLTIIICAQVFFSCTCFLFLFFTKCSSYKSEY